jgi:hypothetical protein
LIYTFALDVELPAMITALNSVLVDSSVLQGGLPVRTMKPEKSQTIAAVSKKNQVLA